MVPQERSGGPGVHGAEPGGCKYHVRSKKERRAGAAFAGQAGGDEGAPRRRFPPEERPPQGAYRFSASDGGQGPTNRASARGKGGGPWGVWVGAARGETVPGEGGGGPERANNLSARQRRRVGCLSMQPA